VGTFAPPRATASLVRISKRLGVPALLVLAGCEFFHPTTVPASDTSKPWAVVALYYDDDHQEMSVGDMTLTDAVNDVQFEYVTDDPSKFFIALGAGVDSGGVHEVRMQSRVTARCVYGPPSTRVLEPWTLQTVTQNGDPGDTVDNGLYASKGFRGSDWLHELDFCSDGSYTVSLSWFSRAEDFHGNVAHRGLGKVTYLQWGS
jgi:hypothetical protein